MAGCSATATVADSAGPSASVTQSAPSVWSAQATTLAGASAGGGTATPTGAAVTGSTLPGLTAACSAAIRAQTTVNDLFGAALKASAPVASSPAAPSSPPPARTQVTTPAATKTATEAVTNALTKADVALAFDQVSGAVPHVLASSFAALRAAADKIPETAAQGIPDVLAAAPVADAMKRITEYITDCQPPTTQ